MWRYVNVDGLLSLARHRGRGVGPPKLCNSLQPRIPQNLTPTLWELPVIGKDDQDCIDTWESYERAKEESFKNVESVWKVFAERHDEWENAGQNVEVDP